MRNLFQLKTVLMTPLIRGIIRHPDWMKSRLFLKAMQIFPEKISKSYDSKVQSSQIQYQAPLSHGLSMIENRPVKILDLCTGTGFAALMAAEHFPDAEVTGVDQSAAMIELAKKKTDSADIFRVQFEVGNAASLGFKDETFDLILSSNAPVYLAEAARVLRSGGDLIVTFSFAGDAFQNTREAIIRILHEYGLQLTHLTTIGNGVVIHGQK